MRFLFTASLLVALGGQAPLGGTTLVRYNLEELTRNAEYIFVGTCTSTGTELVHDQVYTRVQFAVGESIKGELGRQTAVYLPGGRYGNTRVYWPGMPSFAPGEEVVLFLTAEDPLGHAWPVGLAQGKFRVERKGTARQARVFQDLRGISFYRGPAARAAGKPALESLPLGEFLARVRAYAGLAPPAGDEK